MTASIQVLSVHQHTGRNTKRIQFCFTLQFAICHQRAAESDSTNVGADVRDNLSEVGRRVGGEVGVLDHILGHAGEHSSQTHQAVEGSHQLWQVSDLDSLSNGQA